jgi:predicted nuclease with TOPRIM domain
MMRDTTARIVRASLLGQRRAKWRTLEGYQQQKERLKDDIRKWAQQTQEARDMIRRIDDDTKILQEDMSGIVDAYHDLWEGEEFPNDDELER